MSGAWKLRLRDGTLACAIAYNAIVTEDVKLARVPLKTWLVGICLLAWLLSARPWQARRELPRLTVPVLVVGVGIPLVWVLVAWLRHHAGDPVQRHGLTNAVTEASHFPALLLFFPLVDFLRAGGARRRSTIWLGPAIVTAVITLAIWTAWTVAGADYGTHQLRLLSGVIGPGAGPFRVQLVTQIMFVPALAMVLARAARDGLSTGGALLAVAILGAAVVSHTRGYWLALLCVCAIVIAFSVDRRRWRTMRTAVPWLVCLAILAVEPIPALEHARSISEISLSTRIAEAHQLLRGIRLHLLSGSGLGATLPDGYVRSPGDPWSFELTFYQLLFELGIVGLLVLLALPLSALIRVSRRVMGLTGDAALAARVALATLLGLLVADATNPYLINSAGMLALAVGLVYAERALAPELATALPAAVRTNRASTAA